MARDKKFNNLTQISIYIEKDMKNDLLRKGIKHSAFFRQAVQAEAKGDWKYNYMDDNKLEEK